MKRDFAQAFQLFRRAAEQGYAAAQNNLALMYANGQGVSRDFVSAYAWLDVAAEKISGSSELRDQVGRQMTADEIARARNLAAQTREGLAQRELAQKRKAVQLIAAMRRTSAAQFAAFQKPSPILTLKCLCYGSLLQCFPQSPTCRRRDRGGVMRISRIFLALLLWNVAVAAVSRGANQCGRSFRNRA